MTEYQKKVDQVRSGQIAWYEAPSAEDEWSEVDNCTLRMNLNSYKEFDLSEVLRDALLQLSAAKEQDIRAKMNETGLVVQDLYLEESKNKQKWQIKVMGCTHSIREYNKDKEPGDQLEFHFIKGLLV